MHYGDMGNRNYAVGKWFLLKYCKGKGNSTECREYVRTKQRKRRYMEIWQGTFNDSTNDNGNIGGNANGSK